ncbi:MAG: glycosyltransferase family 4 protein [Verrucomicrobia bacterium]|nr:glycosyltransferase family 4 protein [Verrucomicrobiota bacterium]
MNLITYRRTWKSAGLTTAVFGCLLLLSSLTGRAQDEFDRAKLHVGPVDLHPHLDFISSYDDNVFLKRDNRQADFSFVTSPGLQLVYGQSERNFLALDYTASFERFLRLTSQDADNQFVKFNSHFELNRLTIGLAHRFQDVEGPNTQIGARLRSRDNITNIDLEYRLSSKTSIGIGYGQYLHDCLGGHEHRCVLHNCEHNFPKSLGYALRTAFARRSGLLDNVRRFICLTAFQRDLFVREGFPLEKMAVIPNAIPSAWLDAPPHDGGDFVGYVGRISPEKDVPALLEAARRLPEIPFKIAGSYWRMPEQIRNTTPNVEFVGHLEQDVLRDFYRRMRVLVFATRCYENFPVTLLEAMAQGIPIVCARVGGLPEIVEGLFYEPGNAEELAARIQESWSAGVSGRAKALREYHPDVVYARLMELYERC